MKSTFSAKKKKKSSVNERERLPHSVSKSVAWLLRENAKQIAFGILSITSSIV